MFGHQTTSATYHARSPSTVSARLESPDLNVEMQISVHKLDSELPTPRRAHPGDAGLDLLAREPARLAPGDRAMVPTGLAIAIPDGYAGYVMARSGLAAKHGVGVVNSPGLVDSGYRGELKVILINHGTEVFDVRRGDRIAQLVITPVALPELVEVDSLDDTERGPSGFGSTGQRG